MVTLLQYVASGLIESPELMQLYHMTPPVWGGSYCNWQVLLWETVTMP